MNPNVGPLDATMRWIGAALSFALAVAFHASPVIALSWALIALVMAGTALTRFCPLYRLLGISTCPRKSARRPKGVVS